MNPVRTDEDVLTLSDKNVTKKRHYGPLGVSAQQNECMSTRVAPYWTVRASRNDSWHSGSIVWHKALLAKLKLGDCVAKFRCGYTGRQPGHARCFFVWPTAVSILNQLNQSIYQSLNR